MLTAVANGALEVRAADDGGATLVGRFPYGVEAELAPGRREVFAPASLKALATVHLLAQHRFHAPLAITGRSLDLRNGPEALEFEARISPAIAETSHGRDTLAMVRDGLAVGISPGFVVEPGGERVERAQGGILRTITSASLREISVVTRPAYNAAAVEARAWNEAATRHRMPSIARFR